MGLKRSVRISIEERDDDRLGRTHPDRGKRFQHADEDRREDRAAEVAHATNHDDDERFQDKVEPHGVVHAYEGTKEDAAGGGHPGADREHQSVDERHRDPHRLRHDAILGRGTNPDAILAILHEEPERADDRRRQKRDDDPIPGVFEVEEREVASEGLLDLARHRAELVERPVLEHERDAKGREDRRQRIAPEQRSYVVTWMTAPSNAIVAEATTSASQKLPVATMVVVPT